MKVVRFDNVYIFLIMMDFQDNCCQIYLEWLSNANRFYHTKYIIEGELGSLQAVEYF
jgi:hypothetical protein